MPCAISSKAWHTFGNCQRPISSLGVKITVSCRKDVSESLKWLMDRWMKVIIEELGLLKLIIGK